MANGRIDNAPPEVGSDPRREWLAEAAAGKTILGLKDWMAARAPTAPSFMKLEIGETGEVT